MLLIQTNWKMKIFYWAHSGSFLGKYVFLAAALFLLVVRLWHRYQVGLFVPFRKTLLSNDETAAAGYRLHPQDTWTLHCRGQSAFLRPEKKKAADWHFCNKNKCQACESVLWLEISGGYISMIVAGDADKKMERRRDRVRQKLGNGNGQRGRERKNKGLITDCHL